MHYTPYVYDKVDARKYTFTSFGKRSIAKAVVFYPAFMEDVYNLAYGDLGKDDEIDDMTISNNGDIIKIFATIIAIVQEFTKLFPSSTVHFSGSTQQRTSVYYRILRTYYQYFSQDFIITAYFETEDGIGEEQFDPRSSHDYLGFFIKRID